MPEVVIKPAPPPGTPASTYPNAYTVARLTSYRDWWSQKLTTAAKPVDFTPKIGLDATDPLTGLTNECRLTVLYGRTGPSVSPPPPYPFRDEVWKAADEVRKLRDGYRVIVDKGATGKFWSAANAQAYFAATYNRGRTLFDELVTSMRAFEQAQASATTVNLPDLPKLLASTPDWLIWGAFVYLVAADRRRSDPPR